MKDYRSNLDIDRIVERINGQQPTTGNRPVDGDEEDLRATRRGMPGHARRQVVKAVLVGAAAAIVVVGPHFLRTSPTTNAAPDPANGVTSVSGPSALWSDRSGSACLPSEARLHPLADAAVATTHLQELALKAGAVCRLSASGAAGSSATPMRAVLSDIQLRLIEADFNAHSSDRRTSEGGCFEAEPPTAIVAITAQGKPVTLSDMFCTGEFAGAGRYWTPSPATRIMLETVVGP